MFNAIFVTVYRIIFAENLYMCYYKTLILYMYDLNLYDIQDQNLRILLYYIRKKDDCYMKYTALYKKSFFFTQDNSYVILFQLKTTCNNN